MRAVAVFPADRTVRLIDRPAPQLERDSDVLLKMLEVGICGTDREIASFTYGTPPPGEPFLVLGHESLGQVLEVGRAVTRVNPGDLVVTMVRRPCPHPWCRACTRGRQDFCFTGDFTERGIKQRHGFMTELVVDDQRFMHAVSEHLRSVAVLTEPLTVAEKALIQVWDVQQRLPWTPSGCGGEVNTEKALVLGAGPVGLLGALALLLRGFETWVYSRGADNTPEASWVRSVGAKYLSSRTIPPQALTAEIGNIDLIYEATGAASVSFEALTQLGTNGVFVFTGVPGRKAPISLEADLIMRNMVLKNQLVFGTVNAGPDAFAAAITDLAQFHVRWPEQLEALISGRFPIDETPRLLRADHLGIKNVVSIA